MTDIIFISSRECRRNKAVEIKQGEGYETCLSCVLSIIDLRYERCCASLDLITILNTFEVTESI